MKLNNKGFAITAVLYGLLILFVVLVSSFLVVLSIKKDRVEELVTEIENEYNNKCPTVNYIPQEGEYYNVPHTGTYIFSITDANSGEILDNCSVYLYEDDIIQFVSGSIEVNDLDISFDNQDCDEIIYYKNVASINLISYVCE